MHLMDTMLPRVGERPGNWGVAFVPSEQSAAWGWPHGRCVCATAERRIYLDASFLEECDAADLVEVMAHEVAHAVTDPHDDHGPLWQRTARMLGGSGERHFALGAA